MTDTEAFYAPMAQNNRVALTSRLTSDAVVLGGVEYTGSLRITPTNQSQTLDIAGKTPRTDIVVEAIPSNYGRITHSGFKLRVE